MSAQMLVRVTVTRLATVAALLLLVAPPVAEAQQAERVHRIGFLSAAATAPDEREAFRQGLSDHGYVEERNLFIEWRSAEGRDERLPGFAAELVRLKVEIIVTSSTPAAVAAKKATTSIPIVFTVVGDPVGVGLVGNLARPGRNLTGFTNLSVDITQKRLELFREGVPSMRSIVILTDPGNPASALVVQEARIAASRLGMEARLIEVRHLSELDPAFKTIAREGARGVALVPVGGPFIHTHRMRISELATKGGLPVLGINTEMAKNGALIFYGASHVDIARRAAGYIAKILNGIQPGDLPVEQPTKFELIINLKTAKVLGLIIPQLLLLRADQIIQ